MRDILFRGKTKEDKWVYGYLFTQAEGTEYEEAFILGALDYRDSIDDIWKCAEVVDPKTVGQFTGMFDINGTRIFEGDIVRAFMCYGPIGMRETTTTINFNESDGGYNWCYFDKDTIEVIGNIFDAAEDREVV